ncbi:MAG: hypothetical protein K2K97_00555 [Muribaculaceae bacterium]|nr:hypothetical protein [Muribaculaceae bacterium]
MEKKHTHEEFGELKTRYTQVNIELAHIIEQMRENLIARNGGSTDVKLYAEPKVVDVTKCDIEELFAADSALKVSKECKIPPR